MSLSNAMEFRMLQAFFDQLTLPSALGDPHWVALCTDVPHEDGSNNHEVSGNGYGRVATYADDWNAPDFDGDLNSFVDNLSAITFSVASGPWGLITNFALFDAQTGGVMWLYGALDDAKDIPTGSIPKFKAGTLIVYCA